MNFNFENFAREIHEQFSSEFNLDEVKGILYLEDDGYKKSFPTSPQKKLLLQRIIIEGAKSEGNSFLYDRRLHKGVSMWLADNLKGKSSVFKAIKYALTGRESFTPLVRSWIHLITLEFSIDSSIYTVQLDTSKTQIKAKVFRCVISDIASQEPVATFKNKDSYALHMQELFFNEFNYYPIKKVQATQTNVNLSDADLTWATYFSSIYQQSRDYGNLHIGNQHGAVFQMLLGLEFTYSIYAIEVRLKRAERDLSIEHETQTGPNRVDVNIDDLRTQLGHVNETISELKQNSNNNQIHSLQHEIKFLIEQQESIRKGKVDNDNSSYQLLLKQRSIDLNIQQSEEVLKQANKEYNKQRRLINEYQEYIDSGIFFQNLEVTECPHCDHDVSRDKLVKEKENKICMLCDHQIETENEDASIWESKVIECQLERDRYDSLAKSERDKLILLRSQMVDVSEDLLQLKNKSNGFESVMIQQSQSIHDKEDNLKTLIEATSLGYLDAIEKQIERKVNLERDIAAEEKRNTSPNNSKLKSKIALLKMAHNLLLQKRIEVGSNVLSKFEEIMIRQLHSLGLSSYTEVKIDPENFSVYYHQGEIINAFKDISEGEQLRAKLALYLSLIELDIVEGLGRHPRLIILDSPTKEEGDHHFVEGLKNALAYIDSRYGDNVQVMVGTANRELRDVISNADKIEFREKEEFIF